MMRKLLIVLASFIGGIRFANWADIIVAKNHIIDQAEYDCWVASEESNGL